jgi:mannose-6-phosphate isomerase
MYPLRFEPAFRRYIWGGRRLADVLSKPIGLSNAAESWEVVDHGDDQSIVRFGSLAGRTLHDLVVEFDTDLVGQQVWNRIKASELPASLKLRFPLLFKFLDANRNLSVQVHPDDTMGAKLAPPDLGKTEAWYVLHADPGAQVYAGLKPGVTSTSFAAAVRNGTPEELLHSFEAKAGDCIFVEAGTMHAIGAGLLVAEIQQASNTTFRVFDWNRVDEQGNGRPLHIDQALAATHFDRGPVNPLPRTAANDTSWETVVSCDQFTMRRGQLNTDWTCGGDDRFRILAVIDGEMSIQGDPAESPLQIGDTALLPASLGKTNIQPHGQVELLEITAE